VKSGGQGNAFGAFAGGIPVTGYGDAGSAARFFYCAKASRADRNDGCDGMPQGMPRNLGIGDNAVGVSRGSLSKPRENIHPTVKPTELMRWLCRLVTPPGGLVLDPFAGSGSTGRGALLEGFRFIGIELDPDYAAIARARIAAAERLRAEELEEQRLATAQGDMFGAPA
jgi:site-specific DNA-methyltransferase (adenine-specific)